MHACSGDTVAMCVCFIFVHTHIIINPRRIMYIHNNYRKINILIEFKATLRDISGGEATVEFNSNINGELEYKLDDDPSFIPCSVNTIR